MYNIDFAKIENVVVEGIDMSDYPKFCDAYIAECDIDGVPATEEELDAINANYDFLFGEIHNAIH